MKTINNIKYLVTFVSFLLILFFISGCGMSKSYISFLDIEEIPNTIFDEVYIIEIGQGEQSYTYVYEKDIEKVIETLKTIEVFEETVLDDPVEERDRTNYIFMRKENGGYVKIFMDKDNKKFWVDKGDDYSFRGSSEETDEISNIYEIKNKNIFNELYEPLKPYTDTNLYNKEYLDGRVFEVLENKVVFKEERLDTNNYIIEDWLASLKNEYILSIDTKENEKELFEKGDKIRIKLSDSSLKNNNEIDEDEIEAIYYINEILYLKNVNGKNTAYFTEEEISLSMDETLKNMYPERQQTAIWYMYCDDKDTLDAESYIKGMREDYVLDIENTLFVFIKVFPSRGMEGADARDNMDKIGKYGLGGFYSFERHNVNALKK